MNGEPSIDLLRGTLDLLVLKTLAWAQPMHGYAVSKWLRERTDGLLGVEESALYQSLHRLERRELIESEWGLTETNRRAKFYSLTARGNRQLAREISAWELYTHAVQLVLDPAQG
jgi:PadR family transcriptional regulator, regulatory protein PadR